MASCVAYPLWVSLSLPNYGDNVYEFFWGFKRKKQMLSTQYSAQHRRYLVVLPFPDCLLSFHELVSKELALSGGVEWSQSCAFTPKHTPLYYKLENNQSCLGVRSTLWLAIIPLHSLIQQWMKRCVSAISWLLPNMMVHLWLQVGCCEIQLTLICPEAGKHGVRRAWCLLHFPVSLSGMTKLGQAAELIKTPFHISADPERNIFPTSEPLVYD